MLCELTTEPLQQVLSSNFFSLSEADFHLRTFRPRRVSTRVSRINPEKMPRKTGIRRMNLVKTEETGQIPDEKRQEDASVLAPLQILNIPG